MASGPAHWVPAGSILAKPSSAQVFIRYISGNLLEDHPPQEPEWHTACFFRDRLSWPDVVVKYLLFVARNGCPSQWLARGRPPRSATRLLAATAAVHLIQARAGAENHADYRYEDYQETGGRIGVQTHSVLFEQSLKSGLTLRGSYVHDAVSGASPTGAPPPTGSSQVPLKHMDDERNAGFLEAGIRYGRFTTTPQISYSLEHDYESIAGALTQSIDLNQKNTMLSVGYSHNADTIMPEVPGASAPRTRRTTKFTWV